MSIEVNMLGGFSIVIDGNAMALPTSKRTRGLLAFLIATQRPHRRTRLSELFWDNSNDPRASLRWALSKIRPVLNQSHSEKIKTERDRVWIECGDITIDYKQALMKLKTEKQSAQELIAFAQSFQEYFLDGLDLPDLEMYQRWLNGERLEVTKIQSKIFSKLAHHQDLGPLDRIYWVNQWLDADPFSTNAASAYIQLMELVGDTKKALSEKHYLSKRFKKAGISWSFDNETKAGFSSSFQKGNGLEARQLVKQKIRFCKTEGNVKLAYATMGAGYPLVKAANWLNHLEHDLRAPIWSPLYQELAKEHLFLRYDERGNGLSDWDISDLNFEMFVKDLQTVIDVNGLDRFALLGMSQGASVSIEYAVKYPDKVSHLILFGGYAAGWRVSATPEIEKEREAIIALTESGWGRDEATYRHIFSSTFMPEATKEELDWFNDFQRLTTSARNAARFLGEFGKIDVREKLSQIQVPTLVIHSKGDKRIPVATGIELAASIPNAELLLLESQGHLLLGREAASEQFVSAIKNFIKNG